ncbi:MAG: hypothetical protein K2N33_01815, partial [Clostridia bacterium]|nr:hypothetical protein [Clostridia bacterium]
YYAIIAVGVAALSGGVLFLFLRPMDAKIARRIDEEYGLNEKVQTMVACKDKEGFIYELQRADASEKLAALPRKKISFKQIWQYLLIFLLSVAIFIPAIVIPMKTVSAVDNGYIEFSKTERELVELLVDDINESELSDETKTSLISVLQNLILNLEGEHTELSRKSAVIASVTFVDALIDSCNTYKKVCSELVRQELLKSVSDAIVDGITMFKSDGTVLSFQKVKEEAEVVPEYVYNSINKALLSEENSFREDLRITKDDGFVEKLTKYVTAVTAVLTGCGNGDGEILASFKSLKNVLDSVLEKSGQNYAESTLQGELDSGFPVIVQSFAAAVSQESYNCLMGEYVRNRLAKIFNISLNDLPALRYGVEGGSGGIGSDDPADKDDDKNHGGGMGDGNMIYGSDDEVYDHELGQRVKYGEVINKHYTNILNLILEGNLTEDFTAALDSYFSILMGGANESE